MQQTNAKAIAAAIVTLIVGALAGYAGYAVSDEIRSALEIIVTVLIGAGLSTLVGYFAVHQTSNAPAGAVIAAVPETAVGTLRTPAVPVKVTEDAAGTVKTTVAMTTTASPAGQGGLT